ncbi:MAG: 30S ribosome-binding factor RbfA [Crocinitomicaceae bacterium]
MSSIRQRKIQALLQEELGGFFRENARTICLGAMVSVTEVRVAPDMSYAKVYLSIFGHPDTKEVHGSIHQQRDSVRYEMGKRLGKSLRRIPEFSFHIDNSLDYAEEIDNLLKD